MTLESGSLPGGVTGLMSVETEPGIWAWLFEGTFYDEFGIFTFTVAGTDANGCVITPKEYTVEVWARFEDATANPLFGVMTFAVSGLPATIGTGVRVERIEYSATVVDNSAVGLYLDDTGIPGNQNLLINGMTLSGSDFTDTVFERGSVVSITSASAPYTGTFSPSSETPSGFDAFNGSDTNGNWSLYFSLFSPTDGEWIYARIIFRPI
jgi:hypothetical protein